ncbi:hypothetical protein [Ascidiimonas aurantiaca]|uniref:hypothetical protein n=1 Tax=Ascidiimonas aurantiaca TaxID=1685432 RepID=UPI0030EF22EC
MKKKKLNQLQLKKTTISKFSKHPVGGQLIGDNDIIVPITFNNCTLNCPSLINCPTLFNCPTLDIRCDTLRCPTFDPVGCGPTNTWVCP